MWRLKILAKKAKRKINNFFIEVLEKIEDPFLTHEGHLLRIKRAGIVAGEDFSRAKKKYGKTEYVIFLAHQLDNPSTKYLIEELIDDCPREYLGTILPRTSNECQLKTAKKLLQSEGFVNGCYEEKVSCINALVAINKEVQKEVMPLLKDKISEEQFQFLREHHHFGEEIKLAPREQPESTAVQEVSDIEGLLKSIAGAVGDIKRDVAEESQPQTSQPAEKGQAKQTRQPKRKTHTVN